MTHVLRAVPHVLALVGEALEPSEWLTIDQKRIDAFAATTGDFQWIHVDRARAAGSAFGTTVAHGFLTLALIPLMLRDVVLFENLAFGLNYGCERVRFPSSLREGSRIRLSATIVKADCLSETTVQTVTRARVDIEGGPKPVCVADLIARYAFAPS